MFRRIWGPRHTRGSVLVLTAALLTLGAALIHLAVAPAHLDEYLPFGLLFLGLGSAQALFAVELALRPTRRLALIGAGGSAGVLAVWVLSRTSGLPIGPTPWVPEPVGLADTLCSGLEAASVLLFLRLAWHTPRRRARRPLGLALKTLPSAILVTALTATSVAAALSEMPEAHTVAPPLPDQPTTSVTSLTEAPGDQPVDRFTLTAAPSQIDGQTAWTYNGTLPGPTLRVTQGHRVQVTLVNQLPVSTTIHWHGLAVPNAEDGVAGVTQDAVPPGATYVYEFVAREAGTYWYHSHQATSEQLEKGLFGALVVEPPGGHVAEDVDAVVMLHGGAGRVRMNGSLDTLHLAARPGQTVRLRIVNAVAPGMDGGPETPMLIGAPFEVVALDGRDLHAPGMLEATRVPLGMGQRADLVFTMPQAGAVRLVDAELTGQVSAVQRFFSPGDFRAGSLVLGDGPAPATDGIAAAPLFDFTQYGTPVADPPPDADLVQEVVLAEHPGLRDGRPQLIHTINGQTADEAAPIPVRPGQRVRLQITNQTNEYHPMHLHGHVLQVVARDGQPLAGSPVQLDSLLVGPRETWDVVFSADNPGVWMFHCHVLLHAEMGMSTSIVYQGFSTPFEMGARSGNTPE